MCTLIEKLRDLGSMSCLTSSSYTPSLREAADEIEAQQAAIDRLTRELTEAKADASYEVAVDWRNRCRAAKVEIEQLRELSKTPNPARDIANECNALLKSKDEEIERLREELAEVNSALSDESNIVQAQRLMIEGQQAKIERLKVDLADLDNFMQIP